MRNYRLKCQICATELYVTDRTKKTVRQRLLADLQIHALVSLRIIYNFSSIACLVKFFFKCVHRNSARLLFPVHARMFVDFNKKVYHEKNVLNFQFLLISSLSDAWGWSPKRSLCFGDRVRFEEIIFYAFPSAGMRIIIIIIIILILFLLFAPICDQ